MAALDPSIIGNLKTPEPMSLADMVNLGRSATALKKEQALLEPGIEAGKAESETKQIAAKKAKLGLDTDFADKMRQNQIALINHPLFIQAEQDPNFAKAHINELHNLITQQKQAAIEMGLDPAKAEQLNAPYHVALDSSNGQGGRQFLKTRVLSGLDTQAQANLQQPTKNAFGQTVITNPIQETTRPVSGQNLNPTTAGVQNFSDYQKDLTTRVASATQNELRLNEAENLMKEFKPGAGSRTYVDVAQKLQAVGAPQDLVDKVAKGDLSAAQSLNKFIAQTVIQAATSSPGTAESINRYIRDNPDIGSDPRALERFFEFTRKQNSIPIEEQKFLIEKATKGTLNPDTHVSEAQQHILKQFAGKESSVTSKEPKNATYGKYKGRDVVSFDGGKSWEYK